MNGVSSVRIVSWGLENPPSIIKLEIGLGSEVKERKVLFTPYVFYQDVELHSMLY